jgi:hypothetical protein
VTPSFVSVAFSVLTASESSSCCVALVSDF